MTATRTARARRHADRCIGQHGVALVIALIVLVAMGLASAAMVRAVDTTITVTGNLALREASAPPANAAVEEAIAALHENNAIADREQNLRTQNYYASRQSGEDARGIPALLQSVVAYPPDARTLDGGNGNTVRYVIERMCLRNGPASAAHCALLTPPPPADGSGAVAPPVPFFRVTVRVDGPQGTVTHVQAMLRDSSPPRRLSWRLLGD